MTWTVLIFIAFLLGQWLRIPTPWPELHLLPLDLLICVYILLHLPQLKQIKVPSRFKYFVVICAISLLISLRFLSVFQVLISGLYLFRLIAYLGFIFLTYRKISTSSMLHTLSLGLIIFCWLQYFFYPDLRLLPVSLGWDEHLWRIVGPFLDPGFTGFILAAVIWRWYFRPFVFSKLNYLLLFVSYLTFAFTYSRSSYLAFTIAGLYLAFRLHKFYLFFVPFILIILSIILLPRPAGEGVKLERTSSIYARLDNWHQSLQVFSSSPLIGHGFNTYRYTRHRLGFTDSRWLESHAGAGADSSWLLVLADSGLIGFILYICLWAGLWRNYSSPFARSQLSALAVHSWLLNSQFYPFIIIFIGWLLLESKADNEESVPA